jgi:cytoskeletal protein CcmA (bactofilin family)
MGLFSTTQSDDSSSSMANQTSTVQDQVNLVGEGTVFEGTVRAESDVRASGRIVGTLEVEGKTMIAEEGVVEGEIIATNADIAGQVDGEIHVEERLVLKSTARVEGKIETDRLIVEEGAQFTGECEMGTPIPDRAASSNGQGPRNGALSSAGSETDDEAISAEDAAKEEGT